MASSKAPEGHFTMLYFASAASLTRRSHDHIAAPMSIQQLSDHLESVYPGIKQKVLSSSAITINLDYIDVEDPQSMTATRIKAGDEVAIIPPVSSG